MNKKEQRVVIIVFLIVAICIAGCVAVSVLSKNQPDDNSVKSTISDELRTELSKAAEKTDTPAATESTTNSASPENSTQASSTTLPVQKQRITVERAKAVALKNAGLVDKAEEVVFTEQKLDKEKNGDVYEIEFYNGKNQWEYEIDAYNGEIISYSCEAYDR